MTTHSDRRLLAAVVIVGLALVVAPAALAQEERQEIRDVAESREDMFSRSDLGNVAQAALLAYGAGDRDLKRAQKLEAKLGELEGKKLETTQKKIAKAYEGAQASFREALSLDPKMIEAYVGLGQAFRATGQFPELLQVATQGLRLDSTNEVLFAGWAESLMKLDRLGDATQVYAKLTTTNPAWAELLMGEMKAWLTEHQADPGELDPADVEKMATWIGEQEAAG